MRDPAGAPPPPPLMVPELLGTSEPVPPIRPRRSRLLKTLARIVLWSLVAVGALRGLVPAQQPPAPVAPAGPRDDRQAAAVATAFLREYLTVGDDRTERDERLGHFAAAGVDLRESVSVAGGAAAQYADLVVAAGSRPVAGGFEVTVLAHVLQLRSGAYREGGMLVFVVPLAVRREGIAVAGRPRPASLPVGSGPSLPRPPAPPPALSRAAGRLARQAVVAAVAGDAATLARLGGGRMPSTRPLPAGWRVSNVGSVEVAGPPAAPAALVAVHLRPPLGRASYLAPVRVQLDVGPLGLTVSQVDLGGSA